MKEQPGMQEKNQVVVTQIPNIAIVPRKRVANKQEIKPCVLFPIVPSFLSLPSEGCPPGRWEGTYSPKPSGTSPAGPTVLPKHHQRSARVVPVVK